MSVFSYLISSFFKIRYITSIILIIQLYEQFKMKKDILYYLLSLRIILNCWCFTSKQFVIMCVCTVSSAPLNIQKLIIQFALWMFVFLMIYKIMFVILHFFFNSSWNWLKGNSTLTPLCMPIFCESWKFTWRIEIFQIFCHNNLAHDQKCLEIWLFLLANVNIY